jgi:hypothetical protein
MKLTARQISHVHYTIMKAVAKELYSAERLARMDPLVAPPDTDFSRETKSSVEAIRETYTAYGGFTVFEEADIAAEFKARGLPPWRIVEAEIFRKHHAILKRKRIRNDEECALMEDLLADQLSPFDEAEQELCGELLADYQRRRTIPKTKK